MKGDSIMSIDPNGNFGMVFDIDHYAVHDGPGIRTCIYLKGCSLSCAWCHSPESQTISPQTLFSRSRCIGCGACIKACPKSLHLMDAEGHTFLREGCTTCGRCAAVCPSGALFVCGRYMALSDVVNEALEDKVFYKNSGGGVTITGGEVLYQPAFTRRILQALKEENIHTIVETSGFGREQDIISLAPFTDIFYYDFKLGDKELFEKYTGGNLETILENLTALRKKTDGIVLRIPLIPGITDSIENITSAYRIAHELEISTVHLLPYNASADAKYDWCGRIYSPGKLNAYREPLEKLLSLAPQGIEVCIIT